MIRIKNRPPTPPTLNSRQVNEIKQTIADIFDDRGKISSKDFVSKYWREKDVRNALWNSQNGKCCFCENKRAKKREFDAEHFRPKAGVSEEQDHPGYWWLAYEWSNLLYACKPCNQEYKKNQFPLLNRERAWEPTNDLNSEEPVLISPIDENPEEFISFDWQQAYGIFVKAISLDAQNRGNETIKIFGLNRDDLLEERAELTELLDESSTTMKMASRLNNQQLIEEMKQKIKNLTSSRRRFAGFRRAFFRASGLGQYVASD